MFEFLTTFSLILQNFTDWLSYTTIVLVLILAVGQIVYFFTTRK